MFFERNMYIYKKKETSNQIDGRECSCTGEQYGEAE